MRTNLDIRHIPQRMILRQRLRIRNVQRRTTQLATLQRIYQRILIEDLAARDVREVGFGMARWCMRTEDREFLGAQEVRGGGGQGERDDEMVEAEGEEGMEGCFVGSVVP